MNEVFPWPEGFIFFCSAFVKDMKEVTFLVWWLCLPHTRHAVIKAHTELYSIQHL